MHFNVGMIDRVVRIGLGLFLLFLALATGVTGFQQALFVVMGCIAIGTGGAGYCLVYEMLGVRTCRTA